MLNSNTSASVDIPRMTKENRTLKRELEHLRSQLLHSSVKETDMIKGLKMEINNLTKDKENIRE